MTSSALLSGLQYLGRVGTGDPSARLPRAIAVTRALAGEGAGPGRCWACGLNLQGQNSESHEWWRSRVQEKGNLPSCSSSCGLSWELVGNAESADSGLPW